jgi:hypothetical protein
MVIWLQSNNRPAADANEESKDPALGAHARKVQKQETHSAFLYTTPGLVWNVAEWGPHFVCPSISFMPSEMRPSP